DRPAVRASVGARLRAAARGAGGQRRRQGLLPGGARLRADVRRAAAQERHRRQGLHRRTAVIRRRRRPRRRDGGQRRLRPRRPAALPDPRHGM
ncbi:MAG: hypothetical protein AVDCRST_MAG69-1404, partial [uncultured Solirubrobacteraceae bacterium]